VARGPEAVLEAVRRLNHPTADEVFDHLRASGVAPSRATVYRNLANLVERGELSVRDIGSHKRYDPFLEPHVHVHDVETGTLRDVPMTPALRAALAEIAEVYLASQADAIIELRGRLKP